MQPNLITIIIPCYNAERFIEKTINSVLNQSYPHFEVIIVNDGSKDSSQKLIEQIAEKDQRIKYFYQSNKGVSAARNQGIELATGNFIAFLDADDIWEKHNLLEKINFLNSNNAYDWIYCNIDLINIEGELLNSLNGKDSNILEGLLLMQETIVPGISSNVLCRKKCFNNKLKFDINLSTSADLDFALNLSKQFNGKHLNKTLVKCLKYGANMSENIKLYEKDMLYLMRKSVLNSLYKTKELQDKSFANFYQTMFICFRKTDKKKSVQYFFKMLKANPFAIMSLFKKYSNKLLNH